MVAIFGKIKTATSDVFTPVETVEQTQDPGARCDQNTSGIVLCSNCLLHVL